MLFVRKRQRLARFFQNPANQVTVFNITGYGRKHWFDLKLEISGKFSPINFANSDKKVTQELPQLIWQSGSENYEPH